MTLGDHLSILAEVLLWFPFIASSVNIVLVLMFIYVEPVWLSTKVLYITYCSPEDEQLHSDHFPNPKNSFQFV